MAAATSSGWTSSGGVEDRPAAALSVGVGAEHGERADEQAAQLAGEIVLALDGLPAEVGQRRCGEGSDPRLERGASVAVDEPAEAAERDAHRLPHGELALAGEALEEREQLGCAEAAGDRALHASSTRL